MKLKPVGTIALGIALTASCAHAQMTTQASIPMSPDAASPGNHPNASLTVNGNSTGGRTLDALVGELDPTLLTVSGTPGAPYFLLYGSPRRTESVSIFSAITRLQETTVRVDTGTIGKDGTTQILLDPGAFIAGDEFTLQALVADPSLGSGLRRSARTVASTVPTMAASIGLLMPIGSVADIRGPVLDMGTDSVTIGNITYAITPKTEFSEGTAGLADISIGDWLVIDGEFASADTFSAKEINKENAKPLVRVTGRVQGLGPGGFTVLGVSFFVNSETTYTDEVTGDIRMFGDIQPGMVISIHLPAEAMFPAAASVELDVPTEIELEPEPEPEPEIEIEIETEIEDQPRPRPFCS